MTYFFLFSFFLFSAISYTQGIKFYEGSLESAKIEAKKQNKFIFIDCYTTWCGPCKWLAKNVFTNQNVGKYYNQHFINYALDMEKGEGKEFAKKYNVSAYPTLLFIDASGNIQHRYVGACDTTTFIAIGKQALDTINNFGSLLRKYQKGERNPEFLARYALTCSSVYYPYDINEYLKTQSNNDLISEINLQILERYTPNIQSREFIFVLRNFEMFASKYSFERIYNYLTNTMNKSLHIQLNQKGFDPKKEINTFLLTQNLPHSDFWNTAFLMEFYGYHKVKNFQEYIKISQSFLKQAETIPQYFKNCLLLNIESVKNKIKDENLLRNYLEIIEPYQKDIKNLATAENIFSLINMSIVANKKEYANQYLALSKDKITNDTQRKEFEILEQKINSLQ